MKNKILILALFGLFFGARMSAQNLCGQFPYFYAAIEFTNITQAGGSVCLVNHCLGTSCCYNIPTCPGSTVYVCLDGNGSGVPGDCVNLYNSSFITNGGTPPVPCFEIEVTTGGGLVEDYTAVYLGGSSWSITWLGGNHYTSGGVHIPDFFLEWDSINGALWFQLASGTPAYDDESDAIAW